MTGPDLPVLSPESRAFCDGCVNRALMALGQLDEFTDDDEAMELIREAIGELTLIWAEHELEADR